MDSHLYYYIKYKVSHLQPAIYADVITNLFMSTFEIPWEMDFANYEDYREFVLIYEEDLVFNVKSQLRELEAILDHDATLWVMSEDIFSKLLYTLRTEFVKSNAKNEYLLHEYSSKMLYYANIYYSCGLNKAPKMAFVEVYRLACDYRRAIGY